MKGVLKSSFSQANISDNKSKCCSTFFFYNIHLIFFSTSTALNFYNACFKFYKK